MVHKDCCRAIYRHSRVAKDTPFSICLNKSIFRILAEGQHPVLRDTKKHEPGAYEGILGLSGKLLAVKSRTRATLTTLNQVADEIRASNHA